MAGNIIFVKVGIRWWWRNLYFPVIKFLCWYFQCEPNWERIEYWLKKAVYFETIKPRKKL